MLGSIRSLMRHIFAGWLIFYILIAAFLFFILSYHIGTRPAGLSPAEVSAKNASQSLSNIFSHPLNAPHRLIAYLFIKAGLNSVTALRLSSAVFGELFIICFYSLARSWFGKTIGLFGAAILATTPLFLIDARQGSAEIMLFSLIAVMAIYAWLTRTKNQQEMALISLAVVAALALYTPGLVWWIAGALIFSWKKLAEILTTASKMTGVICGLLICLLIVPLGLAIAKDWTIIKYLGLVPAHFEPIILTLKHLVWMTAALFLKAPYIHALILGRLPVLNIIQITFLIFGVYAMWTAAKTKTVVLTASILFGIIAAGLNNNLSLLALCLPALAIFIAAGLRYLYIEWRGVFPRNPLAKNLALLLMVSVVIVNFLYGLRYSLVAWPHSVSTKTTYVLK